MGLGSGVNQQVRLGRLKWRSVGSTRDGNTESGEYFQGCSAAELEMRLGNWK